MNRMTNLKSKRYIPKSDFLLLGDEEKSKILRIHATPLRGVSIQGDENADSFRLTGIWEGIPDVVAVGCYKEDEILDETNDKIFRFSRTVLTPFEKYKFKMPTENDISCSLTDQAMVNGECFYRVMDYYGVRTLDESRKLFCGKEVLSNDVRSIASIAKINILKINQDMTCQLTVNSPIRRRMFFMTDNHTWVPTDEEGMDYYSSDFVGREKMITSYDVLENGYILDYQGENFPETVETYIKIRRSMGHYSILEMMRKWVFDRKVEKKSSYNKAYRFLTYFLGGLEHITYGVGRPKVLICKKLSYNSIIQKINLKLKDLLKILEMDVDFQYDMHVKIDNKAKIERSWKMSRASTRHPSLYKIEIAEIDTTNRFVKEKICSLDKISRIISDSVGKSKNQLKKSLKTIDRDYKFLYDYQNSIKEDELDNKTPEIVNQVLSKMSAAEGKDFTTAYKKEVFSPSLESSRETREICDMHSHDINANMKAVDYYRIHITNKNITQLKERKMKNVWCQSKRGRIREVSKIKDLGFLKTMGYIDQLRFSESARKSKTKAYRRKNPIKHEAGVNLSRTRHAVKKSSGWEVLDDEGAISVSEDDFSSIVLIKALSKIKIYDLSIIENSSADLSMAYYIKTQAKPTKKKIIEEYDYYINNKSCNFVYSIMRHSNMLRFDS